MIDSHNPWSIAGLVTAVVLVWFVRGRSPVWGAATAGAIIGAVAVPIDPMPDIAT